MQVYIRTTMPIIGERKEWLNKCAPHWCIRRHDDELVNDYNTIVKTTFYLELAEQQATLYRIAFPETILDDTRD